MDDFPVQVYMRLCSGPSLEHRVDFIVFRLAAHNCLDELRVMFEMLKPLRFSIYEAASGEVFAWDRYPAMSISQEQERLNFLARLEGAKPARLDSNKDAKPKTRLLSRANPSDCIPDVLHRTASTYEDESGKRTPLKK